MSPSTEHWRFHTAISRASVTNVERMCVAIDQPTIIRLNTSSTKET